MILNHEEIKDKNIIEGSNDKEFANGSYNLTVMDIIDINCNISDKFILKPQGMVYVVFKEKLKVPSDVIGFAHIKTTLTKKGIMATNIGIIDPCYEGFISTLLINFGKMECLITRGDAALRVTFAKIKEPNPNEKIPLSQNNLSYEKYINNTQKNMVNLDEKFLNLNSVEKEVESKVKNSVFTTLLKGLGVFTVAGFLVSVYFQYKNSSEKDLDRAINKYEMKLELNDINNVRLTTKIDSLNSRVIELEKSIPKPNGK